MITIAVGPAGAKARHGRARGRPGGDQRQQAHR
jgi:hypothetical protein